ncbi:hypothetical protein PIB30_021572 [Stylosanthes scabra]|uniref:Uncharacterized protein n=1 Tax=Stylosanthes scabra TaxID=79078 RepID=A0ABU6T8N8_9FABA|nr:hypothetical protein [Stylosanthes scabra]
MANHFSQYAVLLLLTTSSVLTVTAVGRSSEACKKDGGENNCSSSSSLRLTENRRCEDTLHMPGGGCDKTWCWNACALAHLLQGAQGKCLGFFRRPTAVCICTYDCN